MKRNAKSPAFLYIKKKKRVQIKFYLDKFTFSEHMNEFIRKDLGLNCLTGKVKSWLLYSLIMKTSEQRIWPEKNIDLKGLFKGNRFNFLVLIFLAYCTGFKFAFS